MVISFMYCAWSQTAVADGGGGRVAGGRVGTEIDVFVGRLSGRVGVLNATGCVICACTVNAAAVSTAFGASVGVPFLGRLQAERMKIIITIRMEILRATLNILILLIEQDNFTPHTLLLQTSYVACRVHEYRRTTIPLCSYAIFLH